MHILSHSFDIKFTKVTTEVLDVVIRKGECEVTLMVKKFNGILRASSTPLDAEPLSWANRILSIAQIPRPNSSIVLFLCPVMV